MDARIRLLTALSVVQLIGLLLLGYMVMTGGTSSIQMPGSSNASDDRAQASPGAAAAFDDASLRRVIREELTAHARAAAMPVSPPVVRDPAQDRLHKDRVEQQLAQYKRIGAVSPRQMQDLQDQIARLDPAGRKEMLSKLTRALNAREIDGRF